MSYIVPDVTYDELKQANDNFLVMRYSREFNPIYFDNFEDVEYACEDIASTFTNPKIIIHARKNKQDLINYCLDISS